MKLYPGSSSVLNKAWFITSIRTLFLIVLMTVSQLVFANNNTIVFLSCIEQDEPQPLWQELKAENPDAVLLIGDNVYVDSDQPARFKAAYATLAAQPILQELKDKTIVDGTWDDHDYGLNDGGREWHARDIAQSAFLDFLEVPEDSPRRSREGVYSSFMLGEAPQGIQVILLDTRYFRGPLKPSNRMMYLFHRYYESTDEEQDMLGDAQWLWLEQQLQKPARLRIIASSIQFVADNHGFERWASLPKERQRMIELLDKTQAKGVLFISGDRHSSELMQLPAKETVLDYPLYDLTSSGFNSALMYTPSYPSNKQVGRKIYKDNFGRIKVDWSTGKIQLDLIGESGQSFLHHELTLEDLNASSIIPGSP